MLACLIRYHDVQVICVAEGAGQEAMEKTLGTDASGNPILADVGIFLRDTLKSTLKVRR